MTLRLDHPLVVGAGVAGLSVALDLPEATVLSSGRGSTALAQGGIAAAVGSDDSPRLHAEDTISVSGGLAVEAAVEILCRGGPGAVDRLLSLGARFDRRTDGSLQLGLEAGHRRRRIVKADGDSIGREVSRILQQAAGAAPSVDFLEGWTALDLLWSGSRVTGVVAADPEGIRHRILARGVVLATGGLGHLYLRTTNPPEVNGSGIAMAGRAGARVVDLEFVQFHPTALDIGADPLPLVTEALRGEGAQLVDEAGHRFMASVHPDAELAPRDVVSRAIWQHRQDGSGVFLDARAIPNVATRFPTVASYAASAGLHPAADLLPISPAAHYLMGGIEVDGSGRTSLHNLWAVGEVASTGVHGANRLASNSLLEGMVFAARVADDVSHRAVRPAEAGTAPEAAFEAVLDEMPEIDQLRALLWDRVGVVRTRSGLEEARRLLQEMEPTLAKTIPGRVAVDVAEWITRAALARTESRGAHFRADLPQTDPRPAIRNGFAPRPQGGRR